MLRPLMRWLRGTARPVSRPPVMLPPLTPSLYERRSPPLPRPLKAAPYNSNTQLPSVREYEAIREREFRVWTGAGLDGAIVAYRAARLDLNRKALHDAYLQLLCALAEPTPSHHVDYHALPRGARVYLLGAYLGTLVGHAFPRLCWDSSNPSAGSLTYVFAGGPADPNTWRRRLPDICAWLGETWTIGETTANTITLIRRSPLPEAIPFNAAMLKRGAIFLGIDAETRAPCYLPFADMTSGTFVTGASGTGKSNALHIIIQSLLANAELFEAIYLVDGKDGVAFNRYRRSAPGKVHVLWEEEDVWRLTSDLVAAMRTKNKEQRDRNIENATTGFIVVVIDEMATFTAKPSSDAKNPDNKRHAQFIDELTALARRGRSTGLRLIISAQEPVVEQIPASIRANCLTTLAFRLPMDAHATAVFGQLDTLPADPRRLLRGRALIKNGLSGEVSHVQFPTMRMA